MTWEGVVLILGVPLAASVVVYIVMHALDLVDSDSTHKLLMKVTDGYEGVLEQLDSLQKAQSLKTEVLASMDAQLNKANTEFAKLHEEILSLDERLKFVEGRPSAVSPLAKPYFARK